MNSPVKVNQNEIVGMGSDKDGNTHINLSNGAHIVIAPDGMIEVSSKSFTKKPEVRRTFSRKIEIRFR